MGLMLRYQNAGNPSVLSMVPKNATRVLDVGCGAGDNARIRGGERTGCGGLASGGGGAGGGAPRGGGGGGGGGGPSAPPRRCRSVRRPGDVARARTSRQAARDRDPIGSSLEAERLA